MVNFEQEIKTAFEKKAIVKYQKFSKILNNTSLKIYIIGKNEQSSEIVQRYKVTGLIDDYSQSSEVWHGVPIIKTKDVDNNSVIVNCVTSICPVQVREHLKSAGMNNVIQLSDLISDDGNLLSLPWFVAQQRAEINLNLTWWNNFYTMMSDDLSKKILLDVIRFRLTADSEYMNYYEVRLKDQYFENFMEYQNEVFVDAGGYDGDTTEEFINRYSDYKKVYLFEPSQKNIRAARQRLNGRRDIDFKPVGLSDTQGKLHFNAAAGSASAVIQGGSESISVVTLDEEVRDKAVSFIKMDIEGWEINALRGAEQIIREKKPKLAIAVYHAAKDFREIPQYVLNLNPNYKIYFRHYTQGWSESVMFFK